MHALRASSCIPPATLHSGQTTVLYFFLRSFSAVSPSCTMYAGAEDTAPRMQTREAGDADEGVALMEQQRKADTPTPSESQRDSRCFSSISRSACLVRLRPLTSARALRPSPCSSSGGPVRAAQVEDCNLDALRARPAHALLTVQGILLQAQLRLTSIVQLHLGFGYSVYAAGDRVFRG